MKMWLNEDGSVIVPGSLSLWCHFPAGHRWGTVSEPLFLPKVFPGDTRAVIECSLPPGLVPQAPSLLSSSQAVLTQPQSAESLLCARHVCSPFMASYTRGPLESMAIVQVGTLRHTETRSKWASIRIGLRKMDRGRPTQEGAGESGQ